MRIPARKGDWKRLASVAVTQCQRSVCRNAANRPGSSKPRSARCAQPSSSRDAPIDLVAPVDPQRLPLRVVVGAGQRHERGRSRHLGRRDLLDQPAAGPHLHQLADLGRPFGERVDRMGLSHWERGRVERDDGRRNSRGRAGAHAGTRCRRPPVGRHASCYSRCIEIVHKGLLAFYKRGTARRLPATLVPRIRRILSDLDAAVQPGDMNLPGYRLHRLTGDRRDQWSVRVSGNWRIVFRFKGGAAGWRDLGRLPLERARCRRCTTRRTRGESLRDALEAEGWTVTEAAARLGCTRQTLSRLLHRSHGRLAGNGPGLGTHRFGSNAAFWVRRQAQYDLAQERVRQERGRPVNPATAAGVRLLDQRGEVTRHGRCQRAVRARGGRSRCLRSSAASVRLADVTKTASSSTTTAFACRTPAPPSGSSERGS